jgi:hypothetical protein
MVTGNHILDIIGMARAVYMTWKRGMIQGEKVKE